jgi:hypothetical protein
MHMYVCRWTDFIMQPCIRLCAYLQRALCCFLYLLVVDAVTGTYLRNLISEIHSIAAATVFIGSICNTQ